ncbi:MAG: thiamine ABC transporter substrate binding subunit [Kiloniellaceae bacterium]
MNLTRVMPAEGFEQPAFSRPAYLKASRPIKAMERPMRLATFLFSAALTVLPLSAQAAEKTLTVYTYDSFTSDWGPGPAIKEAFEADCGCTLEFVALDSSIGVLSRLRLEGENTKADVVLGLDLNILAEARDSGLLAPHGVTPQNLALPVAWDDDIFLPFDYGYFAFVYDTETLAAPPKSLKELVEAPDDLKIILQDPRTSTPGLGLLLWVRKVYGDEAPEAWARLAKKTVTTTKGWSEAYGLFLEGEAPMVLSYTTSPAYHMIAEDEQRYQAAAFAEGHYMQVEVAAMTKSTDDPDLARRFLEFMLSPGFQSTLPTGQWMYPVIDLPEGLPEAYNRLVDPAQPLLFEAEEVAARRGAWVEDWLQAVTR